MPADAVISKEFGAAFANLIANEGDELASWLTKSGIIKQEGAKRHLNIDALRAHFGFHCAVMAGHLPNSSWPRQRRKTELRIPSMVCTCVEFLMHADCEHILYVKALTDETMAAELQQIPVLRKRGRKRKEDATGRTPKARKTKGGRLSAVCPWVHMLLVETKHVPACNCDATCQTCFQGNEPDARPIVKALGTDKQQTNAKRKPAFRLHCVKG